MEHNGVTTFERIFYSTSKDEAKNRVENALRAGAETNEEGKKSGNSPNI